MSKVSKRTSPSSSEVIQENQKVNQALATASVAAGGTAITIAVLGIEIPVVPLMAVGTLSAVIGAFVIHRMLGK